MNNLDLTLRPYLPDDYPKLKTILSEGGLFYELMDKEERVLEKIHRDPESILVAISERQIVGTVSIMEDGRMPFVFRLAVETNFRNRGIGTRLMEAAEEILKKRGYGEVNILVEADDSELKDYYERQNYEKGSIYQWMSKELGK